MFKLFLDPFPWIVLILWVAVVKLRFICRMTKEKKWWYFLTLAVTLIYLLSIKPVKVILAYPLEKGYLNSVSEGIGSIDYVIILGGGVKKPGFDNKTYPMQETFDRLMYGIYIVNKYNVRFLLLSGGNNAADKESEAQSMARIVLAMGLPQDKIIQEEISSNTWQQAERVNSIINDPHAIIGIVTSGIHMKRSIKCFKKYFKNIISFPSASICRDYKFRLIDLIPSVKNMSSIHTIIVEYAGVVWYVVCRRFETVTERFA